MGGGRRWGVMGGRGVCFYITHPNHPGMGWALGGLFIMGWGRGFGGGGAG